MVVGDTGSNPKTKTTTCNSQSVYPCAAVEVDKHWGYKYVSRKAFDGSVGSEFPDEGFIFPAYTSHVPLGCLHRDGKLLGFLQWFLTLYVCGSDCTGC